MLPKECSSKYYRNIGSGSRFSKTLHDVCFEIRRLYQIWGGVKFYIMLTDDHDVFEPGKEI